MIDAGDAVRAELREHEQALLEDEEAEREAADQAKLQVRFPQYSNRRVHVSVQHLPTF